MNRYRSIIYEYLLLIICFFTPVLLFAQYTPTNSFDQHADSIPESEINIPIQINLKPIYALMEKSIDKVFTSPNWPNDWVQEACATRYKYHFQRSPLQLKAYGNRLDLSFTGYYKMIGSTRLCLGTTAITPWTPECKCGFSESPRRVNVKFINAVSISSDLKFRLTVEPMEPVPIDKCTVCFWEQDITDLVMKGLKEELRLAQKEIEDSFSVINLRPHFQSVWDLLNTEYKLYDVGWLKINPTGFRITSLHAKNDSLNIGIGLKAKPVIGMQKTPDIKTRVPDFSNQIFKDGFSIHLDAHLNYDSLRLILKEQLLEKRFEYKKGIFNKYVVVKDVHIYGRDNQDLVIVLRFEGSENGDFFLSGKPFFNNNSKVLEIKGLDYDLNTKGFLLKSANWLMSKKILTELELHTRLDLANYIDSTKSNMTAQLNTEWAPGIKSVGKITDVGITTIHANRDRLFIRSQLTGNLSIKVNKADFSL